jgi:sn-glycerol 3-phosphate transport system permease protein
MFTIWPSVKSVRDSAYQPPVRRGQVEQYVGLENYRDLFDSDHYIGANFIRIFKNTVFFVVVSVGASTPLALTFALLLNRRLPLLGVWRFSLFYPAMLPLIGAASIWSFLYAGNTGLYNTVLHSLGFAGINWLGDPQYARLSVTIVMIWQQASFYMIFYLAGLQGIPETIYEAAEIEGASFWQQFRHLTLPLLRRTHLFVLVTGFIAAFQTVEQLQALGRGAPNDRSNLLLYYVFQRLSEPRNWGYINAMTVILVGIIMIFTVSSFILFEKERE